MSEVYKYKYPHPAVAVDCVVFGIGHNWLEVLLIKRMAEPFKDYWALPGGFVKIDEDLDDAARRELKEETNIEPALLEQLYTFGRPERDPRERVITVVYYTVVLSTEHQPRQGSDAKLAMWHSINNLPSLAFDHSLIINHALSALRRRIKCEPFGMELLPNKFTLSALQRIYEIILNKQLDKRNFRKALLKIGIIKATDEFERNCNHRPARLYSFDDKKYLYYKQNGYHISL